MNPALKSWTGWKKVTRNAERARALTISVSHRMKRLKSINDPMMAARTEDGRHPVNMANAQMPSIVTR